jgi:hypothetical protein
VADDAAAKLQSSAAAAEAAPGGAADPASPCQTCSAETAWIEIELVGVDGKGIADEKYLVALPDGTERTGKTDALGLARLEGIPAGTCHIKFPGLDDDAWDRL